uniref:Uncharacterized protein n=1 Tax=Heterorhabditis bacteriophora TaxID=37862 RepID=A0A1I7XME4_HETBA
MIGVWMSGTQEMDINRIPNGVRVPPNYIRLSLRLRTSGDSSIRTSGEVINELWIKYFSKTTATL